MGLNFYDYGARNYDSALGRWMNIDPLAEKFQSWSPYNYCFNDPVKSVDPDGRGPIPYWLLRVLKGQSAHRALTDYLEALNGEESNYWKPNKAVNAPDDLLRPDVVYDNGTEAGVWELKPAPPAATAFLAPIEAKMYASRLNKAKNTNRFKVGTTGKAPSPFIGEIIVTDSKTSNQFLLKADNSTGAIFWTEISKKKDKKDDPVIDKVPVREPGDVPLLPILVPLEKTLERTFAPLLRVVLPPFLEQGLPGYYPDPLKAPPIKS